MRRARNLDRLPYAELSRPGWYSGNVASVIRMGPHRLLRLREASRDGSELWVWVSSVAIDDLASREWARWLDARPMPTLSVQLRGRFVPHRALDRLTADVYFPEDIDIGRVVPTTSA